MSALHPPVRPGRARSFLVLSSDRGEALDDGLPSARVAMVADQPILGRLRVGSCCNVDALSTGEGHVGSAVRGSSCRGRVHNRLTILEENRQIRVTSVTTPPAGTTSAAVGPKMRSPTDGVSR